MRALPPSFQDCPPCVVTKGSLKVFESISRKEIRRQIIGLIIVFLRERFGRPCGSRSMSYLSPSYGVGDVLLQLGVVKHLFFIAMACFQPLSFCLSYLYYLRFSSSRPSPNDEISTRTKK